MMIIVSVGLIYDLYYILKEMEAREVVQLIPFLKREVELILLSPDYRSYRGR